MTDQEYAKMILARCSYRMSGIETAICQAIEQSTTDDALPGVLISVADRRAFDGLKTQFAAELK